MKIIKLTLFTNQLDLERQFYEETLGFELLENLSNSFTIKIGWSELTFQYSEVSNTYHYCFLVPVSKFNKGLRWLEDRATIIGDSAREKIYNFEDWNAQSFYFYDASGNLAEFIAFKDIDVVGGANKFVIDDIIGINEIGMPTSDIAKLNQELEIKYKSTFWKGDTSRFGTNGSPEGRFLLPNYKVKETWFPTGTKINPVPFDVVFENKKGEICSFKYENETIISK